MNRNLLRSLLLILVENLVHLLGGQVLVKIIVHLRGRSPTASANAFDFFQRKHSVRRRLFVSHPELLNAVFQNVFTAAYHATDVGANLNVELPSRLCGQHRVIADHIANLEVRQFEPRCYFLNNFIR